MHVQLSTIAKRAIGLAFATTMIVGGLTSAAAPAAADADTSFRDANRTAVLAVYPFSDTESRLSSFKIRGPKAGWLKDHALTSGYVSWRVIIETAPTKNGPWTFDRKSSALSLLVDDTSMEQFPDRKVDFKDRAGTLFVRVKSKLVWYLEDDKGPIASMRHLYTRYGLVPFSGIGPDFGDQTMTRSVAPNILPS